MKKPLRDVLLDLQNNNKSLLAFNLQNLYQLEAASFTSNKLKLPLIIQFSERYLRFLDNKHQIEYLINKYSNDYVYFHLDHCIDLDFIKKCIDSKFDSVMYDGSSFDLSKNIENTISIIEYAKKSNCLLEGELGKVSGVEDGFGEGGSSYAEIAEIESYIHKTGVDLMALGIGNAHGFYEDLGTIRIDILKEASLRLNKKQFFVLHGGTGLPEEIIREAISYGVVKLNVSTHIKKKTIDILKSYLEGNELYNEITFDTTMIKGLSQLFEKYLTKYTK